MKLKKISHHHFYLLIMSFSLILIYHAVSPLIAIDHFEQLNPNKIEEQPQIKSKGELGNITSSNVYGEDDRTRITPTTSYPWSPIVKLYMSWGSNNYIGSGVLIDKNHVLTAGHCAYSGEDGGWADSIKVVPAEDNGVEPYGHAWVTKMRSYEGWTKNEHTQDDIALLTLDQDIGLQTGWMNIFKTIPSNPVYRGGLNLAGYPGDLDNGLNLYWDYDYGRIVTDYNHWYYMDTGPGQSGAPVWIDNGTHHLILSIHTCGNDGSGSNHGTRIDQNKFYSINNWITSDATSINKPDLTTGSNSFAGSNVTLICPGITNVRVQSEVHNAGTIISGPFTILYYLSNDTIFSATDYLITIDNRASLSPTCSIFSRWSGVFPINIPTGSYYLGRIVDYDNNIDEFNENNNIDYVSNYKLSVDATSPSNPEVCNQTEGTTESNVWQNTVNDPSFIWSGATDEHTGIEGYYYYWGSNPNGTSTNFITIPYFDPPEVTSGVHYLRVCTRDGVGNTANWTTIYTFKYDSINPKNPSNCLQVNGFTETNIWQGTVNNPAFEWSEGVDNDSEIEGYYIYWGEESEGTSAYFTSETNFTPSIVDSGIYYLRIQTQDNIGNVASWSTLYTFKYDGTPPINPLICYQTMGNTETNVWQGDTNDPFFIWSGASDAHTGVEGYYVYWGINPTGFSSNFTSSPVFDPAAVRTGTYYLRISTKDFVGNNASWNTLYIFKYDSELINSQDSRQFLKDLFSFLILLEILVSISVISLISLLSIKHYCKKRKKVKS